MFECFHCMMQKAIWQADFDFDDFGMGGEGIVHSLTCSNCGADIYYFIRTDIEYDK